MELLRPYLHFHNQLFHFLLVVVPLLIIPFFVDSSSEPKRLRIDWAYSPIDLMRLAFIEDELYKKFGNTKSSENRKSIFMNSLDSDGADEIQRWSQDYKESSQRVFEKLGVNEDSDRMLTISDHPFLSLRMLKRFSRLNEILQSERYEDQAMKESEFFKKIKTTASEVFLPNETDVKNVMRSILEMQFVYELHGDHLLEGIFGGTSTNFGISLEDAFDIGLYAKKLRMYIQAVEWLFTVHGKLKENPTGTDLKVETVFAVILEMAKEHDEIIEQINETNYYDHYNRYMHKFMSDNQLQSLKTNDTARFLATKNTSLYPAYTLLCVGKDFMPEIKRANLRCWYERKSDLAWFINPLKMEVLSWDPYLLQIHDAIDENTILHMRQESRDILERASTENYFMDKNSIFASNATTTFRTSLVGELYEKSEDTRVLQAFERKVGRITGLGVFKLEDQTEPVSEPLLISSYAFGGQFAPHLDTADSSEDADGNPVVGGILATFMFYLNDVRLGGYTVFPELGISVVPERGSALFWYDHLPNGTPDRRMLHAGCPVILGQKFIGTKSLNKVGFSAGAAVVHQHHP